MKINIEVGKTYIGLKNECEFTVLSKKQLSNGVFCTIQVKGEQNTREHAESFLEHLLIKEK